MYTEEEVLKMVDAGTDLGFDLFSKKKYTEAEVVLGQVLKVNPDNIRALRMIGLIKYNGGKSESAILSFKEALKYSPDNTELHSNIALCYGSVGQFDQAIAHLNRAIELDPNCHFLYCNIGLQYRNLGQVEKAKECFRKSLDFKRDDPPTWCMLGGTAGETGDLETAQKCFETALEFDPLFPPAHCDLANVLLTKGEYEKGFREYEWRFQCYDQSKFWLGLYDPQKRWTGQPLNGKRLLLHTEQGIGDSIHFFRYVKYLPCDVIVHCQPELESLFLPHVKEVYLDDPATMPAFKDRPADYSMPEYDYFASIMSLPHLLNNPPIPETPYLFTDKKADVWAEGLKVGICWGGSPMHPDDARRSCFLKEFKILERPGVWLLGLQKDKRHRQYRNSAKIIDLMEGSEGMGVIDLADRMETFEDTAAILKSLDLLISVDTSIVHLAGALNVPTWVLVPYCPDWRWKLAGDKTEWYPSVRLFRQPKPGDWASVFQAIKGELWKGLK